MLPARSKCVEMLFVLEMLFVHLKRKGLAVSGCVAHTAPKTNSPLGQLLRIFGASPNLWPDRLRSPPRGRVVPVQVLHRTSTRVSRPLF